MGESKHRLAWAERRRAACGRPRAAVATLSEAKADDWQGTRRISGRWQRLAEAAASMAYQQESMEEADESASWEHGRRDVQRHALERA